MRRISPLLAAYMAEAGRRSRSTREAAGCFSAAPVRRMSFSGVAAKAPPMRSPGPSSLVDDRTGSGTRRSQRVMLGHRAEGDFITSPWVRARAS